MFLGNLSIWCDFLLNLKIKGLQEFFDIGGAAAVGEPSLGSHPVHPAPTGFPGAYQCRRNYIEFARKKSVMVMVEAFSEILDRPTMWTMILGFIRFIGPVWIAFFLGVMVGWAWKPRRDSLGNLKFEFSAPSSPSSASISAPVGNRFGSIQNSNSCIIRTPSFNMNPSVLDNGLERKGRTGLPAIHDDDASSPSLLVTVEDLNHLCHLVERKDGGPPWKHVMDRSAHGMSYQAWQRDPEGGPPQYCSRTVYEDATPELLRDFFWDDEFRMGWDDMIINSSVIEECPTTGTMVVHWTRKFPFFCSDREYIVGRRIWESGRSYYCVTKGVPCLSVPRRDKPRRVDLFYSSWYIQAVKSPRGDDGHLSACEVILFHHEDMGISRGIAKFGVRQGMWGAVKNIERGFRAYQKHRASGAPLSHHAFFAQINTRLDPNYLRILEGGDNEGSSSDTNLTAWVGNEKQKVGVNIPKLVILGGALAMACCLDRGVLTKTLIFGLVRKFGNIGRGTAPSTN